MTILLSIVALLTVVGHLAAMVLDRDLWPFSRFPMYSFPIASRAYPILRGEELTLYTLEVVHPEGRVEDLLSSAAIYPPWLHPLDRPEVSGLLRRAGLLDVHHASTQTADGTTDIDAVDFSRLRDVLKRLGALATERSGAALEAIRLVRLTWTEFRDEDRDPRRELVVEVRL